MNKFIEKAVEAQDKAYSLGYAEKEFAFSCHLCATRGLLHRDCITCPVNTAHCRAVAEIHSGEREELKKSFCSKGDTTKKVYKDRHGHVTLTLRDIKDASITVNITINEKEAK